MPLLRTLNRYQNRFSEHGPITFSIDSRYIMTEEQLITYMTLIPVFPNSNKRKKKGKNEKPSSTGSS
jgi:hypothetical protein